jgi:hypothetical protein
MNLSQQVDSLSTYAFLAAPLEIKHGSSCFTGPLYADSQATIKNIIFTIAKLQILNPNLKFYIILEGTDRLEVVYASAFVFPHWFHLAGRQTPLRLSDTGSCSQF